LAAFLAPVCAAAVLSGCSTFSHKDHKIDPVKPRALPPPVARTDGASTRPARKWRCLRT